MRPISEEEVLSFPSSWKIPAVLFYQRVDANELLDFSALPLSGDPAILCQDITISRYFVTCTHPPRLELTFFHKFQESRSRVEEASTIPARRASSKGNFSLRRCRIRFSSAGASNFNALCFMLYLIFLTRRYYRLQEEAEFHSDGTKKVIRPSRMTLARVSVLRGEGPDTGIPFIDDHIHTSDTIVDYLTEFSGIRGGSFFSRQTRQPSFRAEPTFSES